MNKYYDNTKNLEYTNYYVSLVSKNHFAHIGQVKVSLVSGYNMEGKIKRLTENPELLKLTVAYFVNDFDREAVALIICENDEDLQRTLNDMHKAWLVEELWMVNDKIVRHEKTLAAL
jgi:hypothetical protein